MRDSACERFGVTLIAAVWLLGLFGPTAADAEAGYMKVVLDDEPLVYWRLGESGGTTAQDATDYDRDGTHVGNGITLGQPGALLTTDTAYGFDGTHDYVEDADAAGYLHGLTALSVEAWVKSNVTNVDSGIFTADDGNGNFRTSLIRYDKVGFASKRDEVIQIVLGDSDDYGYLIAESSAFMQTTSWQHLVMTWALGSDIKLFINGQEDIGLYRTSREGGVTLGVLARGLRLGWSSFKWDGLDEFAIYGRALEPEERREHYNAATIPEPAGGVLLMGLAGSTAVWWVEEKGGRNLLCEAPSGPFRQKVPDPFFRPETNGHECAPTSKDRFYPCRIAGGDYHHRHPDRAVAAGRAGSPRGGTADALCQ